MIDKYIGTALLFLVVIALLPLSVCGQDTSAPEITDLEPAEGSETFNRTPLISAQFQDETGVDRGSVIIIFDDTDVTDWEETRVTPGNVTHQVPSILPLSEGNHSVYIEVADQEGNRASVEWTFQVNTSSPPAPPGQGLDLVEIAGFLLIALGAGGVGFAAYILHLHRTKGFTFEKYFAQHPVSREYLFLYLPVTVGLVITLF
ncbi:MAG: hypothetical protein ACLFPN_06245, partial [Methanomassiliicoccales archaeon]